MIYYFRTDTFENRNLVAEFLEQYGYNWIDASGSQISFEKNNDFKRFTFLIQSFCYLNDIVIHDIKHCKDPGIGLF